MRSLTLDWERLEDETPKAYDAFCTYRAMKPAERSIDGARAKSGKAPGQIRAWERWSTKHRWVARVKAWDDNLAALMAKAQEDTVQEMAKRHAALGQNFQIVSNLVLQEWSRRIKNNEVDLEDVPVDVLSRLTREAAATAKVGVDMEIRASGKDEAGGVGAHFKLTITDEGRKQLADLFGDDDEH